MPRRRLALSLAAVAGASLAVFVILTVLVSSGGSLALDSRAFEAFDSLRAPWLDTAARAVTTLGVVAIVGPALAVGAALLLRLRRGPRAAALAAGGLLAWFGVWVTKSAVGRARPPGALVRTAGESFPSAHAANSVGWLALALALAFAIPNRAGRIAAVAGGALLAALIGWSRIYLRAHYASDVLAGEAWAVGMYAIAALGGLAWGARSVGRTVATPASPAPRAG